MGPSLLVLGSLNKIFIKNHIHCFPCNKFAIIALRVLGFTFIEQIVKKSGFNNRVVPEENSMKFQV